jgi:hypothetical protein
MNIEEVNDKDRDNKNKTLNNSNTAKLLPDSMC